MPPTPDWLNVALLALLAGATIPVGAGLASIENIHPRWLEGELRHTLIAFGGGALLSAVALVLVPRGSHHLPLWAVAAAFLAGGLAFMALDLVLARRGSSAGQLVAMLSDFLPESIALGASFATGTSAGVLLALLIALQNLPEGFNAYREIQADHPQPARPLLRRFALTATLGPAAGLAGYFFLAHQPHAVAVLMLFSAAGILYLTFQDIAPQVPLKQRHFPPLGAVAGFLLGLLGEMLLT